MKVVIIGTGNVATTFGRLLQAAGLTIVQVYGRSFRSATLLANTLNSQPCDSWDKIDTTADLYIVAVSDHAVYEVAEHIRLADQLVVHTAGSVSIDVLKKVSSNYGVLYPLQSIRKEVNVATAMPLLIHANNEKNILQLVRVAKSISSEVEIADDQRRLKFHIAAVVVNNFVNHLYAMAEAFCKSENISFRLLVPLIQETAIRMQSALPAEVLTGPAVRNDQVTIDHHLSLLKAYPGLQLLYTQLTESIRQMHAK